LSTSTDTPVRVRFAPSPTGYLHIGGARTALFNWLFARHHNGAFILRIEDTDRKRYVPDALEDITAGLRWLGLDWDEGPEKDGEVGSYFQSERLELYHEWSEWLIEHGHAYRCTCTPERLKGVREAQQKAGQRSGYDRHCRDLQLGPDAGQCVVRFKMPLDGETVVHDVIRGDITFQNDTLEDLVLLKSDGYPTYHLANVVDDHFMQISHIMRADEWISTAPLHRQLYAAFGWEMPAIAHMPVILNPDGKGKLSKRTQAFADSGQQVLVQVREYREVGYLPEAVINFLTNIGWSFGDDEEIFSVEETIPRFSLERINPAGGKFPFDKLVWLNGQWMQRLDTNDLVGRLKPWLENAGLNVDDGVLRQVIPLVNERIKTLPDIVEWAGFFFRDDVTPDLGDLVGKKMTPESSLEALRRSHDVLTALDDFSPESQQAALRALAEELGLKAGQLFGALRVAVTGQKVAPPLFETLEIVGRETTLARLAAAQTLLEGQLHP
jgi:glutamyl-tRNA synthetase